MAIERRLAGACAYCAVLDHDNVFEPIQSYVCAEPFAGGWIGLVGEDSTGCPQLVCGQDGECSDVRADVHDVIAGCEGFYPAQVILANQILVEREPFATAREK